MSEGTTTRGATAIAYRAERKAEAAQAGLLAHEDLCAERYQNIHESIGGVKSILKWGGGSLFTILVALIAFLAVRVLDANDAETQRLRDQVHFLEQRAPVAAADGR